MLTRRDNWGGGGGEGGERRREVEKERLRARYQEGTGRTDMSEGQ